MSSSESTNSLDRRGRLPWKNNEHGSLIEWQEKGAGLTLAVVLALDFLSGRRLAAATAANQKEKDNQSQ